MYLVSGRGMNACYIGLYIRHSLPVVLTLYPVYKSVPRGHVCMQLHPENAIRIPHRCYLPEILIFSRCCILSPHRSTMSSIATSEILRHLLPRLSVVVSHSPDVFSILPAKSLNGIASLNSLARNSVENTRGMPIIPRRNSG